MSEPTPDTSAFSLQPSAFASVPLAEQIACAERELGKRKEFYPKWVKERGMNPLKAEREIAAMEAIVNTLKNIKEPLLL